MPDNFPELQKQAQAQWQAVEKPSKPQILVGWGIHGVAAGAPDVMEAIKTDLKRRNIQADVMATGGLGMDYAEVIVSIIKPGQPRVFYGSITPELVPQLIEDVLVKGKSRPDLALGTLGEVSISDIPRIFERPEFKGQKRIATENCGITDPTNIMHYIARGGYSALHKALFEMTPDKVVAEVDKSNLRGRGGAAFPTAGKWKFLASAPGPTKYILCNGEEGDPSAFNDKHIFESDPHKLLEGMLIAGYATKASKGFVFIRVEHHLPIERIEKAIKDAKALGLIGKNILGTEFSFDIEVALTGESYVSGEETALMEAIEGKRAMPRYKPPFPAAFGVWGKPSNINNCKTYAYAPSIVLNGGDWFAGIGTAKSKGTAIVCLSGHIAKPGIYEVPFGTTLRQVIYDMAGGVPAGRQLKVLQTGGPLGGFLPASSLDMPIDFDGMAAAGAMFGSGGIAVGDDTVSVLELAMVLAEFNADESCGKCFPCRLGTRHMWQLLEKLNQGKGAPGDIEKALGLGETMKASLCAHGQLAENPLKSGYKYFEAEFRAGIKGQPATESAKK